MKKTLSIKGAFVWILLFTILVSGTIGMGYLYYRYSIEVKKKDSRYTLKEVTHVADGDLSLETDFFMIALGLSEEKGVNIYQFPLADAKNILSRSPLLAKCDLKTYPPGELYINYSVRKPLARLLDVTDTLLDKGGILLPNVGCFEMLSLPKVRLGLSDDVTVDWGEKIEGREVTLAYEILNFLESFRESEIMIDVSEAFSSSYGRREIIFLFGSHYLRSNTREYKHNLSQFFALRPLLGEGSFVVDLRIPAFALVRKIG